MTRSVCIASPKRALSALVLCFALALPAYADGPALAHVTLHERTITLTAEGAMVTWDAPRLHLHFAQLHLGFPIPPDLRLTLVEAEGAWRVEAIRYFSLDAPLALDPSGATIRAASGEGRSLRLEITAEAFTPGPLGQPEPTEMEIEVTLSSS